jgi:hypothetical protein
MLAPGTLANLPKLLSSTSINDTRLLTVVPIGKGGQQNRRRELAARFLVFPG